MKLTLKGIRAKDHGPGVYCVTYEDYKYSDYRSATLPASSATEAVNLVCERAWGGLDPESCIIDVEYIRRHWRKQ